MSTAVVELEAVETVALVPSTLSAVELRNALSACLLAADKDKFALPVLHAVHVSKLGNELVFRATDRYRLAQVTITVQHPAEGDWETLISVTDVKRIVATLPKTEHKQYGAGTTLATIAPDAVAVIGTGASSIRFEPVIGEFPRVSSIIPTTTAPVEEIGFNPAYLADIAKMPGRTKNEPVRFKFNGAGKPVLARWGTDEVAYLYLLMPTRVSE